MFRPWPCQASYDGRKKDYHDLCVEGGFLQVTLQTLLLILLLLLPKPGLSDYCVDFGLFGGVCAQFFDGGDSVDDGVLP